MITTRPHFLAAAVLLSGLLAACKPESSPAPVAEVSKTLPAGVTVVHGGTVHTVDPNRPRATALAFDEAGEILLVGDDRSVLEAYPEAMARDLEGGTVIPGLIDSHGHLWGLAESYTRAQLAGTRDLDEVIRRLKTHEKTLGEDDWLLGRGWDQNDWPGQSFPERADLDRHFPNRPVWLRRIDGHAGWANSVALERVDRDLSGDWQEPGGFIHRDAGGEPTGILIDRAMDRVDALVPPTRPEVMREALSLAMDRMLSLGLTGVHDPGIGLGQWDMYGQMLAEGELPVRVYAMADGVGETLEWLCVNGAQEHPSGRLHLRSVKLYEDGALGSRGAALLENYADDPGNSGLLFLEPERLQEQIERVLSCGLQAAVHAIGDRANRVVIDALAAARDAHPDNPGRHRVEHAQVLDAADLPRFAKLGIIAAMQPTHATSDMYWAESRLGSERARFAYAWRSLLDSGAVLAFGSDFPVEAVNPMLGLHAAVTRQDLEGWPEGGWHPEQRVSREEALRAFTLDAAYAGFMEDAVGSLAPGMRADFVVLDRDLMAVPAPEIAAIRVLETWVDGHRVYPR